MSSDKARKLAEEAVGAGTGKDGAVTVRLCDVAPERVRWLWPGRLAAGKLIVLDGDPAVGKSTLSIDIAAHVSTGTPWPDGTPCPAGSVLILSAEDGLADTIRPRLDAAGGDPAQVLALTAVSGTDSEGGQRQRPPTLADVDAITAAVRESGALLVIVDVLMAYLPSGTDSHRDQDIRTVLSRIAAMAEATGAAVLLLRHLNKASGGSPLYRGGGSIGIVGACRAAFLAAHDPDDDTRRVLACTKSNLAAEPPALGYRLVDSAGNHCARVEWLGVHSATAADLLRHGGDDDERTERDEAGDWLIGYLTDLGGSAPSRDVLKAGRAAGFTDNGLKKARVRAGARTERQGFGPGAAWVWTVDAAIGAIGASHMESASMDSMAAPMETPAAVSPQSRQSRQHLSAGDAGEAGTEPDRRIREETDELAWLAEASDYLRAEGARRARARLLEAKELSTCWRCAP